MCSVAYVNFQNAAGGGSTEVAGSSTQGGLNTKNNEGGKGARTKPKTSRSIWSAFRDRLPGHAHSHAHSSASLGHSFSICKALRKSVPRSLRHKSKSDNCLHKINPPANTSVIFKQLSDQDLLGTLESSSDEHVVTNRFTRRVLDLTNVISARVYPSSTAKLQRGTPHSKSLERESRFRVNRPADTHARRARSLERNHRYLVTLDSTCRYSREVGSTQVNLDCDLSSRYQPDPTVQRAVKTCDVTPPHRRNFDSLLTADIRGGTHVYIPEGLIERTQGSNMAAGSNMTAPSVQISRGATCSSIVNKPARGWLHPDHLFAKDGINYAVRYIGCLEVITSMKVLDFDTRSAIAKECINRVCESAGLKTVDKKRRPDKKLARMLGETPIMDKAGANVQLTVTSLWLKLSDLDSGQAIFVHEMPNISFASGGDAETLDFVAYVAKGRTGIRCCYVLECGGGLAQDVITTIGQAFELRFKEFLKRTPAASKHQPAESRPAPSAPVPDPADVEYYNDLPGKCPPEDLRVALRDEKSREFVGSTSSNLIDFNTELPLPRSEPEYVNGEVANPRKSNRDPFDMSPFALHPPTGGFPAPPHSPLEAQRGHLIREGWFHGPISRKDAENLLINDGDFLVRESQGSPGQYVLTGMQNNAKKHLLLVDPEGVVRTKDRTFESVSHLINYHRDNNLPIISAESALRLQMPVVKRP